MQITSSNVLAAAKCVLGDEVVFPGFQLAFLLLLVYAYVKDRGWLRPKTGATLTVKRGKESWSNFHLMYGLLAVVFVEVNNTAEALKGFKTIITLFDLALLFYLCFFNAWFRNKSLGVINASKEMEEK